MSSTPLIPLTRESLNSGEIRAFIAQHSDGTPNLTDAEMLASRRTLLPEDREPGDVWLFGYGSLLWNPIVHHAESRSGTVYGWRRRFCLKTNLGRGTPDCPGLVLALDRGGCCRGVAYRIRADQVEEELDLVWRREMVNGSYIPRWLSFHTDAGPLKAIGFVIDRQHKRFTGDMTEEQVVDMIDRAAGFLGPCSDYLLNTVQHLEELGIPDAGLCRLKERLLERRAAAECAEAAG
jgi:cation transport protein ChaC